MTAETTDRVLVAGVGNIFLGDDGFGVEVARRLALAGLPAHVRVADYGTSGMHLAYDVADGYATTILIDAAPRGEPPGTVTLLEVGPDDLPAPAEAGPLLNGHGMQPEVVLGILSLLGQPDAAGRILVVGCEPASLEPGIGLSEPVAAAVGPAMDMVIRLVTGAVAEDQAVHGTGAGAQPQNATPAGRRDQ